MQETLPQTQPSNNIDALFKQFTDLIPAVKSYIKDKEDGETLSQDFLDILDQRAAELQLALLAEGNLARLKEMYAAIYGLHQHFRDKQIKEVREMIDSYIENYFNESFESNQEEAEEISSILNIYEPILECFVNTLTRLNEGIVSVDACQSIQKANKEELQILQQDVSMLENLQTEIYRRGSDIVPNRDAPATTTTTSQPRPLSEEEEKSDQKKVGMTTKSEQEPSLREKKRVAEAAEAALKNLEKIDNHISVQDLVIDSSFLVPAQDTSDSFNSAIKAVKSNIANETKLYDSLEILAFTLEKLQGELLADDDFESLGMMYGRIYQLHKYFRDQWLTEVEDMLEEYNKKKLEVDLIIPILNGYELIWQCFIDTLSSLNENTKTPQQIQLTNKKELQQLKTDMLTFKTARDKVSSSPTPAISTSEENTPGAELFTSSALDQKRKITSSETSSPTFQSTRKRKKPTHADTSGKRQKSLKPADLSEGAIEKGENFLLGSHRGVPPSSSSSSSSSSSGLTPFDSKFSFGSSSNSYLRSSSSSSSSSSSDLSFRTFSRRSSPSFSSRNSQSSGSPTNSSTLFSPPVTKPTSSTPTTQSTEQTQESTQTTSSTSSLGGLIKP